MKILIIKLSSIGDIVHTFPAIVDLKKQCKNLQIDWLVDESFKEVPLLQNQNNIFTNQVITIPLRKIKKNCINNLFLLKECISKLRAQQYDLVIDAQGLIKSAILSRFIRTKKTCGFNFNSCREPLASFFYTNKFEISKELHAITRIRKLCSLALNYKIENIDNIDYGLAKKTFPKLPELIANNVDQYVVLLHGTTWESKKYWLEYWQQLCMLFAAQKTSVVVTAHTLEEQQFVEQLTSTCNNVVVLYKLNMQSIACMLANAMAVVAVDTGFAHLTGALGIPIIGIYGATSTAKAGIVGNGCVNLQSKYRCSPCLSRICLEYKYQRSSIKQPCLKEITPEVVFDILKSKIGFHGG